MGVSQARGWIGVAATGLHHSSQQHWILNPLSKARDWTCILLDTSWVHYCWATMGTPEQIFNVDKNALRWEKKCHKAHLLVRKWSEYHDSREEGTGYLCCFALGSACPYVESCSSWALKGEINTSCQCFNSQLHTRRPSQEPSSWVPLMLYPWSWQVPGQ